MMGRREVPALGSLWLRAIDDVARRLLGAEDRGGAALADEVRALSSLYTRERAELGEASGLRAARLRFFLPRDLPKIEGPLSELAARGLLPRHRAWRVVDVGAGYGTSTLGLARLARRLGLADVLHVRAIDADARALEAFRALAAATREGGLLAEEAVPIELEATSGSVAVSDPRGLVAGADLVLVGLVLNELFPTRPASGGPDARGELARLELLERWLTRSASAMAEGGALVVVEPALREPTRALQRLRDRLVAGTLDVPFPCTHRAPCPLLARERDWCHAKLPIGLPSPLDAIALAAGLRHEGLSYSTLVVRNAPARPSEPRAATIVGGPIASKGKVELHLCHEGGLTHLEWLSRDGSPPPELHRGAQLTLDRPLARARARHGRDVLVSRDP